MCLATPSPGEEQAVPTSLGLVRKAEILLWPLSQLRVCLHQTHIHPDVQVILCPFRFKELWDGQYLNNWSKLVCMCFILQTFIKAPFFRGSVETIKAERHSLWFSIDGQLHTSLPLWCSLQNEWHACNCWILIPVARIGFLPMCLISLRHQESWAERINLKPVCLITISRWKPTWEANGLFVDISQHPAGHFWKGKGPFLAGRMSCAGPFLVKKKEDMKSIS